MYATFERFDLRLTKRQAFAASHIGRCDDDVAWLLSLSAVARQLDKIGADAIRCELHEYGAWEDSELADDSANRARIVWIAAGNIREDIATGNRE